MVLRSGASHLDRPHERGHAAGDLPVGPGKQPEEQPGPVGVAAAGGVDHLHRAGRRHLQDVSVADDHRSLGTSGDHIGLDAARDLFFANGYHGTTVEQIATRGMAMEQILTDPDQLADYTNRFFTEVYPTDLRTDEQIANIAKGGYVLVDCDGTPDAIVIATGSEVGIAVEGAAAG